MKKIKTGTVGRDSDEAQRKAPEPKKK